MHLWHGGSNEASSKANNGKSEYLSAIPTPFSMNTSVKGMTPLHGGGHDFRQGNRLILWVLSQNFRSLKHVLS